MELQEVLRRKKRSVHPTVLQTYMHLVSLRKQTSTGIRNDIMTHMIFVIAAHNTDILFDRFVKKGVFFIVVIATTISISFSITRIFVSALIGPMAGLEQKL